MRPNQIYSAIQRRARELGRPTDELLTLYGLERFLARLARTPFSQDFALKGGMLLAAYRLRRPTRDIDIQALGFTVDDEHLRQVVAAVASVDSDDPLALDVAAVSVEVIRDEDDYTGLRLMVPAAIARFTFPLKLDVSTGDPIWPAPTRIQVPTVLDGEPIEMQGHPMPMVVAEKTVTMLQRGTTSTRWRDLVDVRSLARNYTFTAAEILTAAQAVASHRGVSLRPIAPMLDGYGAIAQSKWAAWLRQWDMTEAAESDLDAQAGAVAAFVDPVYSGAIPGGARWEAGRNVWVSEA